MANQVTDAELAKQVAERLGLTQYSSSPQAPGPIALGLQMVPPIVWDALLEAERKLLEAERKIESLLAEREAAGSSTEPPPHERMT